MPDLTSTLLAMYQQIIGGSSAREQSALEAECARRVILAGITISPAGTIAVTGGLTVNAFSVATLTVTGAASVGTDLSVGGTLTCPNLNVTSTAGVNTLTVTNNAIIGAGLALTGTLTVTGAGPHLVAATVTGGVEWRVRNTLVGTGNYATLGVGNDTAPVLGFLQAYSSTFTPTAQALPNGVALVSNGANGLSLAAATAFVRVLTGAGPTERLRVAATGELLINTAATLGGGQVVVAVDQAAHANGLNIQNTSASNGLGYVVFYNSASAVAGFINQTGATTVAYTTSSDARLKRDLGRVQDLSALRALPVHDFTWVADGVRDRGVFAQEAHALYPRAVSPGTDETTADGSLARPWMTDYSKFVPDLIAGWQQHDAELAALRAHLSHGAAA